MRRTVWFGLGTNLGDRAGNLARTVRALGRLVDVERLSPVYETAPVGYTEQPLFWNMVVKARTALEPAALLAAVKQLEQELGRSATFRMGPRVIDIDLLMYEGHAMRTPDLELPHAGLTERSFVLMPLLDLDPDAVHPVTGRALSDMEAAGRQEGITRLGEAADVLPLAPGSLE